MKGFILGYTIYISGFLCGIFLDIKAAIIPIIVLGLIVGFMSQRIAVKE